MKNFNPQCVKSEYLFFSCFQQITITCKCSLQTTATHFSGEHESPENSVLKKNVLNGIYYKRNFH